MKPEQSQLGGWMVMPYRQWKRPENKPIQFLVPNELAKKIHEHAEKTERTKTAVMLAALRMYFAKVEKEQGEDK